MQVFKMKEGFTLLEIMISLVIILILVLAFSGAMIGAFRTEARVNERVEATRISDSIVERLRNNRFDWNIDENIEGYTIAFNTNGDSDITINYHKVDENKYEELYFFKIEWEDRNYNTEVLLVGEQADD